MHLICLFCGSYVSYYNVGGAKIKSLTQTAESVAPGHAGAAESGWRMKIIIITPSRPQVLKPDGTKTCTEMDSFESGITALSKHHVKVAPATRIKVKGSALSCTRAEAGIHWSGREMSHAFIHASVLKWMGKAASRNDEILLPGSTNSKELAKPWNFVDEGWRNDWVGVNHISEFLKSVLK